LPLALVVRRDDADRRRPCAIAASAAHPAPCKYLLALELDVRRHVRRCSDASKQAILIAGVGRAALRVTFGGASDWRSRLASVACSASRGSACNDIDDTIEARALIVASRSRITGERGL